eukprot:15448348-Alexandrium_andersonii.AAC.1
MLHATRYSQSTAIPIRGRGSKSAKRQMRHAKCGASGTKPCWIWSRGVSSLGKAASPCWICSLGIGLRVKETGGA